MVVAVIGIVGVVVVVIEVVVAEALAYFIPDNIPADRSRYHEGVGILGAMHVLEMHGAGPLE